MPSHTDMVCQLLLLRSSCFHRNNDAVQQPVQRNSTGRHHLTHSTLQSCSTNQSVHYNEFPSSYIWNILIWEGITIYVAITGHQRHSDNIGGIFSDTIRRTVHQVNPYTQVVLYIANVMPDQAWGREEFCVNRKLGFVCLPVLHGGV
jgi:hypothetical protein